MLNAEPNDIAINETGPAVGIILEKTTLPCLSFSLRVLIENHNCLDYFHSLYAKLFFQLAEPYANVLQVLRMVSEEIATLTSKLVNFS